MSRALDLQKSNEIEEIFTIKVNMRARKAATLKSTFCVIKYILIQSVLMYLLTFLNALKLLIICVNQQIYLD